VLADAGDLQRFDGFEARGHCDSDLLGSQHDGGAGASGNAPGDVCKEVDEEHRDGHRQDDGDDRPHRLGDGTELVREQRSTRRAPEEAEPDDRTPVRT
jgi:hypothetical protein